MDIFEAAGSGDLERVRAVVEDDAGSVHVTDDDGWTPQIYAADEGHVEVVRYLLDRGATVNHRDGARWTALHCACFMDHIGSVHVLLRMGADATAVDEDGATPLSHAAFVGGDAVVRALLEHGGSDVDGADHNRWTACYWACNEGHDGVLRQLLEAGADPVGRDTAGRTLLDRAAGEGHQDCIRVLHEWDRAYTLHWARSVRDASLIVDNSSAPVDAAPMYMVDRATSGLTIPTVHISPRQQHGQPSDDVGDERHVEVGPVAVAGVVTVYAIEELNGEVFVELMELMGITGAV